MSDTAQNAPNGKTEATLPEGWIIFLVFLCSVAIISLAFTPALLTLSSRPGYWTLYLYFGSLIAFTALGYAVSAKKTRRDERVRMALARDGALRQKTPKEALSFYVGFAIIGLIFFCTDARTHLNWRFFVLCNAGQVTAYVLLRWTLSRPPGMSQVKTLPAVSWLPKRGLVRLTPTEIVLAAPWGLRAFVGGFGLIMAGMTVTCLLLAFAPGLFEPHPRHPHDPFLVVMPLCLFVGMVFFTTLIVGSAGPRDLRLELDSRRYTQKNWKPWPGGMSRDGACIPFCIVHTTGLMDEDMAGVCVREYRYKGNISYILQIAWRDRTKPAYGIKRFTTPEESRTALAQATAALKIPACDPG